MTQKAGEVGWPVETSGSGLQAHPTMSGYLFFNRGYGYKTRILEITWRNLYRITWQTLHGKPLQNQLSP